MRSQTPLRIQSFLSRTSSQVSSPWEPRGLAPANRRTGFTALGFSKTVSALRKEKKQPPVLSLTDLRCLKYSSPIGNHGHFSSTECLIMCPGIVLTSLHESEHWANRALPRVESKVPCPCESAPHISRPRRSHLGTAGFRLHLPRGWPMPLPAASCSVPAAFTPPPCRGSWPLWAEVQTACFLGNGFPGWQGWRRGRGVGKRKNGRNLLLSILPRLESCILGETEAQGSEDVLDWNQETRDDVGVCQLLVIRAWEKISSFLSAGAASSIKWGAWVRWVCFLQLRVY